MKQNTNRTMLLLPCAVIAAMIGITTYFACSADDDWEGTPEYLHTHAPMLTRAGMDVGSTPYDTSGFSTDSLNCGGVCLAIRLYEENTNYNSIEQAYSYIKTLAGGSCYDMHPEQILSIGQQIGLGYTSFYTILGDSAKADTAVRYLVSSGQLGGCIFIARNSLGNHAEIGYGTEPNNPKPNKRIKSIVGRFKGYVQTSYSLDSLRYIIY